MSERKNEREESSLAEPDSDEGLTAVVLNLAAADPLDHKHVLKLFAARVREHERLTFRERPTQPDLKVLLDDPMLDDPKAKKGR